MDLLCPVCGEAWDNDEFHEVAKQYGTTYADVAHDFRTRGCVAMGPDCYHGDAKADPRIAATYAMLGSDMDGAASTFDEWGF